MCVWGGGGGGGGGGGDRREDVSGCKHTAEQSMRSHDNDNLTLRERLSMSL